MSKNELILDFILAANGLLFLLLGYLIKYKKKVSILAGYQEDLVSDKDGLANWAGGTIIILGLITLLLCLPIYYFSAYQILIMAMFGATTIIGCIILMIGSNRYKIRDKA